jgi:hypothetical protein
MKNLTPKKLRCGLGTCPAVYEIEPGKLLIIGKRAELVALQRGARIGADETAVIIDHELLGEIGAVK